MSTPFQPININLEQLEAEMADGCKVGRPLDVSLSTLAHLILAAHCAMKVCAPGSAPWSTLCLFARDATLKGGFAPETTKMIADSWRDFGMAVQTPGPESREGGEGGER